MLFTKTQGRTRQTIYEVRTTCHGGDMGYVLKRVLKWVLIFHIQVMLISCATGQSMYLHSFSFDTGADAATYGHPDIDVLDYAYGGSGQFATRPSKMAKELNAEHGKDNFGYWDTTGVMPRGEYLYVKWRVKATGEIHEDKVDLTHKLPADMTRYRIHFAIFGSQLHVYLFPPVTYKNALGQTEVHGGQSPVPAPGKTLLDVPYAQQHQIYPVLNK